MSKPKSNRLFVALWIDAAVIRELAKVQQQLKDALTNEFIRWTNPEQLHLTLRFLGNIPTSLMGELSNAVRSSTAGVHPFKCSLQELGYFPGSREIRIIWVGIEEKRGMLQRLFMQLNEKTAEFGNAPDKRTFQPHLTIARIRRRNSPRQLLAKVIEATHVPTGSDWTVGEISLVQSELASGGSQYSTLESFPLQ